MKNFLPFITIPIIITLFLYLVMFHTEMKTSIYVTDSKFYDYFIRELAKKDIENTIEEIVIVNIDNKSISKEKLGKYQRWPLAYHAKLVDIISADTPKVIAFDIIFDKEKDEIQNQIFVDAVKRSGKVVNALSFINEDESQYIYKELVPPADYFYEKDSYIFNYNFDTRNKDFDVMDAPFVELLNSSISNGSVSYFSEQDGIVRRSEPFTRYLGRYYPFLGIQAYLTGEKITTINVNESNDSLKLYQNESDLVKAIPIDDKGLINIFYYGSMKKFRTVSYYQVLNGDTYEGQFKDKYVLIGTDIAGLYDLRPTPLSTVFPGVAIHANVLKTLMDSNFIKRLDRSSVVFLMLIISVLMVSIVHRFNLFVAISGAVIFTVLAFLISQMIFEGSHLYIPQLPIILSAIIALIAMYAYKYNTEEKDKRMIRSAFSQFVNKSVVDDLLADPSKLKLGGEKKNCSVFFSDIAGFTTISEQLTPEKLVLLLNTYLTDMTNIIFENNGMIDKYIGDAIMAIYGAPVSTGNHAIQACHSAIEQQERLLTLRDELEAKGYPRLLARMGINSGDMVVGNMGSQDYFNYTVMGDTVNLAARLEPANKDYDTLIMIGHNTYEMAKDEIYARQLDLMIVKGKTEPVKVYELMGIRGKDFPDENKRIIDFFDYGYKSYLNRQWKEAMQAFGQVLNAKADDGPAKLYVERCRQYSQNEPASDWTGVYKKTTK